MSNVPSWKRSISKAEYLYQTYQLTIEVGKMAGKVSKKSIECWVAYAKPYNSRQAVKKIVVQYAWIFDVSMSRARILLRRRTKGWITNEKSSS